MHQEISQALPQNRIVPPAQLLIGADETTIDTAIRLIQATLCLYGGCQTCTSCLGIGQQKHYALQWIAPTDRYTLDDIQPIHERVTLALDDNSHYFFVLAHADRLSTSCANTLLKIVEEPPQGYHFIFLSENREAILPTIRSRCLIKTISSSRPHGSTSPLFSFFTTTTVDNPALFLQTLEASKINERDSVTLVNSVLHYWLTNLKKTSTKDEERTIRSVLEAVHSALENPPPPGSSKLFLKNLYLHVKKRA